MRFVQPDQGQKEEEVVCRQLAQRSPVDLHNQIKADKSKKLAFAMHTYANCVNERIEFERQFKWNGSKNVDRQIVTE